MLQSLCQLALLLLAYVALALGGMLALRRLGFLTARGTANVIRPSTMLFAAALNLLLCVPPVLQQAWLHGGSLASLRLALGLRSAAASLLCIALSLAAAALFAHLHGARVPSRGPEPRRRAALLSGLFALLCAAFMEELLFRASALDLLSPLGRLPAMIVSTAVFTAVHFLTGRPTLHATLSWALGGVCFAFVFLTTGSLWLVTALHFARNVGNALFVDPAPGLAPVELAVTPAPAAKTAYYAVLGASTAMLCTGLV